MWCNKVKFKVVGSIRSNKGSIHRYTMQCQDQWIEMTVAISVALCALILYRPRHFINHLLTYLLTYLLKNRNCTYLNITSKIYNSTIYFIRQNHYQTKAIIKLLIATTVIIYLVFNQKSWHFSTQHSTENQINIPANEIHPRNQSVREIC